MLKSVVIKVFGRVQGVYYRQSTKEEADKLGLTGFVQNQADGSVYIQAEGSNIAIEALVKWCYKGPARAKVTEVLIKEVQPTGFMSFSINKQA